MKAILEIAYNKIAYEFYEENKDVYVVNPEYSITKNNKENEHDIDTYTCYIVTEAIPDHYQTFQTIGNIIKKEQKKKEAEEEEEPEPEPEPELLKKIDCLYDKYDIIYKKIYKELNKLNEHGMFHNDVNTGNIFIDIDSRCHKNIGEQHIKIALIDFGCASIYEDAQTKSLSKTMEISTSDKKTQVAQVNRKFFDEWLYNEFNGVSFLGNDNTDNDEKKDNVDEKKKPSGRITRSHKNNEYEKTNEYGVKSFGGKKRKTKKKTKKRRSKRKRTKMSRKK